MRKMKTFVAKATFEYHIGYQYHKVTHNLRVEVTDKKNAIREIRNYFHEKYKDHGIFNVISINEI